MDNAIQLSASLIVTNGDFKDRFTPGAISIDQSAIGRAGHAQLIGTGASGEVVDLGDVAGSSGWCTLRNLDTTNYVTYGPTVAAAIAELGRLNAGEYAVLRLEPSVVLRAKANSAEVLLDVTVYEN